MKNADGENGKHQLIFQRSDDIRKLGRYLSLLFEEIYLPTPAYFTEYKLLHIFSAMQGLTLIEMSRFLYRC